MEKIYKYIQVIRVADQKMIINLDVTNHSKDSFEQLYSGLDNNIIIEYRVAYVESISPIELIIKNYKEYYEK